MSSKAQGYDITTVVVHDPKRERLLEQSKEWAKDLGSLHGSIENGEGNVAGRFGEMVFTEVFGGNIADHYDYDIAYNGLSVDIKTKRRTVKAQPHYEASIADFNPDQDADIYYFMSVRCGDVKEPYKFVDLLGYLPTKEYHEKATFHQVGEKDPSNGFTFSADCWNVEYRELKRIDELDSKIEL